MKKVFNKFIHFSLAATLLISTLGLDSSPAYAKSSQMQYLAHPDQSKQFIAILPGEGKLEFDEESPTGISFLKKQSVLEAKDPSGTAMVKEDSGEITGLDVVESEIIGMSISARHRNVLRVRVKPHVGGDDFEQILRAKSSFTYNVVFSTASEASYVKKLLLTSHDLNLVVDHAAVHAAVEHDKSSKNREIKRWELNASKMTLVNRTTKEITSLSDIFERQKGEPAGVASTVTGGLAMPDNFEPMILKHVKSRKIASTKKKSRHAQSSSGS